MEDVLEFGGSLEISAWFFQPLKQKFALRVVFLLVEIDVPLSQLNAGLNFEVGGLLHQFLNDGVEILMCLF